MRGWAQQNPDFLKLWIGQTTSLGGTMVGRFALPLVAVVTLHASPFEMGLLRTADILPAIALGLFAGVWVDRIRRRPIMIWADLGRALLLATIPLAALLGVLRIEQLYLVGVAVGGLTILFDVAYSSYLPTLVSRQALLDSNAKLSASRAVIEVAGFGIGGALVQLLTAPIALLVDAISFGVSSATLLFLFLTRELHFEPILFGPLFAIGGLSSIVGAVFVERLVTRYGPGPVLVWGFGVGTASLLFVPLAGGPLPVAIALVAAQQVFDAAGTVEEINRRSLVQRVTPPQLLRPRERKPPTG